MLSRILIRSLSRHGAPQTPHLLPRARLPLPETPLLRRFQSNQSRGYAPTPLVPQSLSRPLPLHQTSPPLRRFESNQPWGRFPPPNPRRRPPPNAHNARPLISIEGFNEIINHRNFKWIAIIAIGSATAFYFYHIEDVPISGRRRFNCYSDARVEKDGQWLYQKLMRQYKDQILPSWDPRDKMVQRVMKQLIPASGLENVEWEVNVIESPEVNAFVIPGGKVFVYTGILPIAKTDDGLAAILGHEIAHNLAKHQAEAMSNNVIMIEPIRWGLIIADYSGLTYGVGRILGEIMMEFGLSRPASRKQESEADYIGLMIMAKSCYDPSAAVGFWKRMEEADKEGIPEWISTHPSHSNRIERMVEWLPKAHEERNSSECGVTLGYSKDFANAFGNFRGLW